MIWTRGVQILSTERRRVPLNLGRESLIPPLQHHEHIGGEALVRAIDLRHVEQKQGAFESQRLAIESRTRARSSCDSPGTALSTERRNTETIRMRHVVFICIILPDQVPGLRRGVSARIFVQDAGAVPVVRGQAIGGDGGAVGGGGVGRRRPRPVVVVVVPGFRKLGSGPRETSCRINFLTS